jgi:hypothetical protein
VKRLVVEIAPHRIVLLFTDFSVRVPAVQGLASRLAATAASTAVTESKPHAATDDHHDGHEEQAKNRKYPESAEGGCPAEVHDALLVKMVV